MSNFFSKLGDALNTGTLLATDFAEAEHGQNVDVAPLAKAFVKDLTDYNVNVPGLNEDVLTLGLQAMFTAISSVLHKS